MLSGLKKHPDEDYHFMVSQYYFNHWIPPQIGDPEVRHTYSCWGISYINQLGVEYFLSGKIARLINPILKDELKSVRFFNVFLFLFILFLSFWRYKKHSESILVFLPLLFTPQIWYVFSYFNNDAFPLTLSFMAVSEITYRNSLLNKFLDSEPAWNRPAFWARGIPFGLLLGILSVSKMNYYVFLLFMGFWFVYKIFQTKNSENLRDPIGKYSKCKWNIAAHKHLFLEYSFIILVAGSIFVMRHSLDIFTNGLNRSEKLMAYQEEVAEYPFKPSTVKNDLNNTYWGLTFKEKEVKYTDLFLKWNWDKLSFQSFVGVYGYMDIFSPDVYYKTIAFAYGLFGMYLIFAVFIHKDFGNKVVTLAAILAVLMIVFISSYHSWVNAFQPQGRYFFPVVSIVGLLIYQSQKDLNDKMMNLFVLTFFVLSLYSFATVALKYV